jgi:hypothetical protein
LESVRARPTIEQRRAHLRRYIDRAIISRADPGRRKHQPIAERVEIVWR